MGDQYELTDRFLTFPWVPNMIVNTEVIVDVRGLKSEDFDAVFHDFVRAIS